MAWPYRQMRGRLTRKISSPIGRLDYARVQVAEGAVEPLAVGGASVLSSTTRADGFVIVPDDSEGFAPRHRRRGLALCVTRSSSFTCWTATRRSGAFEPLSTSRLAGATRVPLDAALGRVLAADVISPVDVPSFDRSNVDGFAVVSEDTFGASEEVPRTMELGEETIHTGIVPTTVIRPGTAVAIATGGMVPARRRCRGHGRVRGDQRPPVADRQSHHTGKRRVVSPERISPAARPCCAAVSS